jgi:hypothetical protein
MLRFQSGTTTHDNHTYFGITQFEQIKPLEHGIPCDNIRAYFRNGERGLASSEQCNIPQ